MIPKYTIEYSTKLDRPPVTSHYGTDDPVACEEFLVELLERGWRIEGIKHEGVPLSRNDADGMIHRAAGMLTSKHLQTSLGLDAEQTHYRFGTPA